MTSFWSIQYGKGDGWDVTSVIRLHQIVTSVLLRSPCGRKLRAGSSQQSARNLGPRSNNLRGTEFCQPQNLGNNLSTGTASGESPALADTLTASCERL